MGAKFREHGGPCLEVGERLEKERGEKGIWVKDTQRSFRGWWR